MKKYLVIFVFLSGFLAAQDKLFFANGKVQKGILVSIGNEMVFFKASDTSEVKGINKSDLVMIEDVRGVRYNVATGAGFIRPDKKENALNIKRNTLSLMPLGFFIGRATLVYERMNELNTIGIVIPLSLTYNPLSGNTSANSGNTFANNSGINFLGGMDVNFYLGKKENATFFLGPRARYGTDMLVGKTEGYTLQTQFGWRLGNPNGYFVQHISMGFGFLRIVSSSFSNNLASSQQSYGWYSVNYRMGFRW